MSDMFEKGLSRLQGWHMGFTVVGNSFNRERAESGEGGIGFGVEKMPLLAQLADGTLIAVPENFATVRTDTNAVLGVVGGQYAVHPNSVLLDATDYLIAESGGTAAYEAVMSLRDGRTVAVLVSLKDSGFTLPATVDGVPDRTDAYALFTTSHDGKLATQGMFTNVRVVCWNTLNAAISGNASAIKIRHSGDTDRKVAAAVKMLENFAATGKHTAELAREMSDSAPTLEIVRDVIESLFPTPDDDATGSTKTRHETRIGLLSQGLKAEQLLLPAGGTGSYWTLANAFTRYADWLAPVQARGRDENKARAESVLLPNGAGAAFKAKSQNAVIAAMRD